MSATSPRQIPVRKVAWRIATHEPWTFFVGSGLFIAYFAIPLGIGWTMSRGFGAIANGETRTALWWAAALGVAEILRMACLYIAERVYIQAFVRMQTFQRSNMLTAQLVSGGAESGEPTVSAGEAMTNFRDDVDDSLLLLDLFVDSLGAGVVTLVMGVVLGAANPVGALVLLAPLAMVAAVTFGFYDHLKRFRQADRAAAARVSNLIGDTMSAATTITANDAANGVLAELRRRSDVRLGTAVRDRVLQEAIMRFGDGAVNLGLGLVIIVSAGALADGSFDVAGLALFISYSVYLAFFPRTLGRLLAARRQIEVTYDRMAKLVAERRHANLVLDRDLPVGERDTVPEMTVTRPTRVPLQRLTIDDLTISYDDVEVVADVSLTLNRGDVVVITGAVGEGKSSLLRGILGIRDGATVTGTVRWNGDELHDRAAFLIPPNAAYLPQVPQLVSDSVAANVALGVADDRAVAEALSVADLDADVATMSDGLQTMIGPRGLRLSGGQRQRLAAARAIVSRPELLVLDDLSSAVDVETELRLWQRFADAGLTVIAVSHRDLALERAAAVYRIEGARLVPVRLPSA